MTFSLFPFIGILLDGLEFGIPTPTRPLCDSLICGKNKKFGLTMDVNKILNTLLLEHEWVMLDDYYIMEEKICN